jgi:hypothetical protein
LIYLLEKQGGGGKGFTKTVNSNQGSNRADPSQIIITKNVPFTTQQPSPGRTDISSRLSFANKKPAILSRISSSSITDRLGSNEQRPASDRLGSNERRPVSDRLGSNERRPASDRLGSNERRPASDRLGSNEQRLVSDRLGNNEQRPASITIRGTSRANSQNNSSTTGFSIRGESGPSTVLLSNLDAHTTADDVMVSCQVFGKITSCDVLRDKSGLSYGEAEIKFSTKTAALDCIAQLDNEYADGKEKTCLKKKNEMLM